MTWSLHNARHVQSQLTIGVVAPMPAAELGDITLLPHQRDAVARIHTAMRTHHGALLADDVGLGKTYTALAVATAYQQVHVIAPAAIQSMWRTAITHAHLPHIRLHSVHGFSRYDSTHSTTALVSDASGMVREHTPLRTLVIIDEAHYLRTRRTARYTAIARFVAGCDTLLLSATPLHNRADELRNLLALFLGSRADLLSEAMLAQVVIRRANSQPNSEPNTPSNTTTQSTDSPQGSGRPRVQQHPALRMPHDRTTITHILALPAPLPAHDGAVAGALIRLGLLRAWCSSDAALTHALRQRRLRGDALLHALRAGRHPTLSELRSWLVGDHEVQLAFPELMASTEVEGASLIQRLETHLEALTRLAEHHAQTACGDGARADALRALLHAHPHTPIIAFSQFTQTIGALYRALSDIAGVGLLSSKHARIASGRISRGEVLARFAPLAQERPPPPPHQAIRLLLATDLLAEGVNLQDAGVVVHLDLPWTDALRRQRVGRSVRIASPHAVVHVYGFAPPPAGNRALRLERRLARKAALAIRFAGANDAHEPRRGTSRRGSAADAATRLHARLQRWSVHTAADVADARPHTIAVSAIQSQRETAWIALVEYGVTSVLLCGRAHPTHRGRRIVSARVPALLRAVTLADTAGDRIADTCGVPARTTLQVPVRLALRDIRRWHARRVAREDAGPSDHALVPLAQRAARHLAQLVQQCGPIERGALRGTIADAERVVRQARGSGAEDAMARWCALADACPRLSPEAWIRAWQQEPVLAHFASERPPFPGDTTDVVPWRVRALLLIGSDYPSVCHDTRSFSTLTAP